MKVLHLSHIDLDGYGAQFVAKHFFDDIYFFNANYGKEISVRLEAMLSLIKSQSKAEEFLFLITDLNLNLTESSFLQEKIAELKVEGYKIELLLLDHHISGAQSAEAFHWYHLDPQRSACRITFEVLSQRYGKPSEAWLDDFSNMVNSVDIWKSEGYGFEFGKVAMGMISGLREPSRVMFEEQNRELKFFMLQNIKDYLYQERGEVRFDNDLFRLKKLALGGNPEKETMDAILSSYLVGLLEEKKEELSIFYKGHKGILSYMLSHISIIGNAFLLRNPDFDFIIDANPRGNVSLRANNGIDVSVMASELFGGGGHKNASGGRIEGFRESFFYTHIKEQIQDILDQ